MAAQQGVYRTNGFFMEEENTVGRKKKISVYVLGFKHSHIFSIN